MEEMRELVDLKTVGAAVMVAAVALVIAGVAVGAVTRRRQGSGRLALIRGGLVAILGPVLLIGWHLHLYVTRFDPETGYFGLDKVWVLVVSAVVVIGLGSAWGYAMGRTGRGKSGGQ